MTKKNETMKNKPGAAKPKAKKPIAKKPGAAKPKKGATMKPKKKVSKRVAQLLKLEQVRVAKMQRKAETPPTQAPLINAPDTKAKGKGGEPTKAPLIDTNPSTPQLKDKTAPAPKTPAPKRETGGPETPAVFDDQTDFTDVNDLGVKKGSVKKPKCRGVIAMIRAKAEGGASRRPFGK